MDGSETILYLEFLGQNIRPFLVILMAVSFIRVYKEQKHRSLKKKYNLDDILKVGSQYNPHLNPVICQDLVKSDPDIGPLARDKSPLILAIENNLITVFDIDHIGNNTNRILTPVFGKKNIQKDETIIIKNSYTDTLEGLPCIPREHLFRSISFPKWVRVWLLAIILSQLGQCPPDIPSEFTRVRVVNLEVRCSHRIDPQMTIIIDLVPYICEL